MKIEYRSLKDCLSFGNWLFFYNNHSNAWNYLGNHDKVLSEINSNRSEHWVTIFGITFIWIK